MNLHEKQVTIPITLSAHEWCRLYHMFQHIGEEAHDDADKSEPWFHEEWWNEFADLIEKHLHEQEITACDIHSYDEKPEKKKKTWDDFANARTANGVLKCKREK